MPRVDLVKAFQTPASYQPPEVSQLSGNTYYPNLNSIEYRNKNADGSTKFSAFLSAIDVNEVGTVVIASNDYNSRKWTGSFWGYEKFEDVGVANKELFKSAYDSPITGLRFIEGNMVLLTNTSGKIQLWSTQSEVRSAHGYSLYNIATKGEHFGIISTMDLFKKGNARAVTGSNDNCIKTWKIGACDLFSEQTYRDAHADAVTGVSTSPDSESLFASCSRDKCLSVWDVRQVAPVTDYYEGSVVLTDVLWTAEKGQQGLIYLGDDCGRVQVIDPRDLKKPLTTFDVFKKPIFKIKRENNLLAVLGQTNVLKVFNAAQNYELVYEDKTATDFIRDVYWSDDKTLHTVGWNKQISTHKIIV